MVKEPGAVIGMLMLVAGSVAAQDAAPQPVPVPAPTQTQQAPQTQTPEVRGQQQPGTQGQGPRPPLSVAAMRKQMLTFNGVLQGAVRSGAEAMQQNVRQVTPDAILVLSGPAEVSSSRIPNLGPLFNVRVPGMRPNTAWALSIIMGGKDNQGRGRQAGGVRPTALLPDGTPVAGATPPAPSSPFVDPALLTDPDGVYTREVKGAIVDAMIENSSAMRIGANEFLTVVARDSAQPDPQVPSSQTDFHTITFQIKGADLMEIAEKGIALEEARQRVKITED